MTKANETLARYFQGKPGELAKLLDRKDMRVKDLENKVEALELLNKAQAHLIEIQKGELLATCAKITELTQRIADNQSKLLGGEK